MRRGRSYLSLFGLLGACTFQEGPTSSPGSPTLLAGSKAADSGDTAADDPPAFECPPPPPDALVFDAAAYVMHVGYYPESLGWSGVVIDGDAFNSAGRNCNTTENVAAWVANEEGALATSFWLTLPAAYPPSYVGTYEVHDDDYFGRTLGTSLDVNNISGGAVVRRGSMYQEYFPGYLSVCFSRFENGRISGTLLAVPGMGGPTTTTAYVTFDFQGNGSSGDGRCMSTTYWSGSEEQVWNPDWWAAYDPATHSSTYE